MHRLWKIRAQVGESPVGEPYYDNYLYLDTDGHNKRKIELLWRHKYEKTMFEGTKLEVKYVHKDTVIELTAEQIVHLWYQRFVKP